MIVIVAFVVGLVAMALSSSESPMLAGSNFMEALANGDVEALTELSYSDDVSKEEIAEKWNYTSHVVGPHFNFSYQITGETRQSDDTAVVTMMYAKNAGMASSYDEPYELPMHKVDGKWKVDIFSLPRNMFPGLPR